MSSMNAVYRLHWGITGSVHKGSPGVVEGYGNGEALAIGDGSQRYVACVVRGPRALMRSLVEFFGIRVWFGKSPDNLA